MHCRKWAVQISKRHGGELNDEGEAALHQHLESCRHCRDLETKLRTVNALLKESPEFPVPDFLSQRITASVSDRMRQHSAGKISCLIDFLSYRYRAAVMTGMLIIGLCIGGLAGHNIAGFVRVGPAKPSYDLLVLGEIGTRSPTMDYGLIWQDSGKGDRP